jgi:RNA polymerase sigma-70 factor (ECF subfamily)
MTDKVDPELLRRIEDAVSKLPKLQREIFLAHRLDDMPYREIASRTGLSPRQVERHIAKALYKIVKQLDGSSLTWWERWF